MIDALLLTLAISLGVQAAFFAIAASLRTDKVTDLSYSLTFILLALVLWRGRTDAAAVALTFMVCAWGLRLAAYLFVRILTMGRDARFDGVREHFWRFLQFWFFQGLVVWVIMLPVILWSTRPGPWSWEKTVGLAIWAVGLVLEAVADQQKFRFKQSAAGRRHWPDIGLWRYSRHPNYFGEMLCWWGVFVFVVGDLGALAGLGVLGPVTLTFILLRVTGIPTLEKTAREKWGGDPAYQAYRQRTRLLVPWPKRPASA